jgi:GDP-D-mannose dehydratase
MNVIVTGSCGFIGSHLCEKLLNNNFNVIGIDNFNSDIYDSKHKYNNLKILEKYENYFNVSDDILNNNYILKYDTDVIIHLAGYANVRKSSIFPEKFIKNNILITTKILNEMFPDKNIKDPEWITRHYWEAGDHLWKVGVDSKKIQENIDNIFIAKNIYILGETYSERQSWIEGALETIHNKLNI